MVAKGVGETDVLFAGSGELSRKEVLAKGIELHLGDCREILPTLGRVDAVVTDPPYGIGMDGGRIGKAEYQQFDWDKMTTPDAVDLARAVSRYQVIFGGNYYALPPSGHWLVWDKQNDPTTFADFEMAWTNIGRSSRMIRWLWSGPYMKVKEERFHPTQKPREVMKWCIEQLPEPNRTILDPFMGSGTTGVAAVKLGRRFIGIEIEPKYFDIACRRISEALKQPDLFIEKPKPIKQESFL
jgi:site-specific DNA-methyltransferase (adenine-specific)/modification methylase